jgi:hypothetical protein
MTQPVPLYAVLVALAIGVVLWLIHRWVTGLVQSARRMEAGLAETRQVLQALGSQLVPACAAVQGHLPLVPQLLEAVARVGNAQLEALQQQKPGFKPGAPLPQRDVEAANREFEIDQMMRAEGISRAEAEMRANPANQQSVWEAGGMFEGWGR